VGPGDSGEYGRYEGDMGTGDCGDVGPGDGGGETAEYPGDTGR
jgi:hypothetical protein